MENGIGELLTAHCVIIFVYFASGALILLNFGFWRAAFETQHVIASFIVLAFILSLLLNLIIAVLFSLFNLAFDNILYVLVAIVMLLLIRLLIRPGGLKEIFAGVIARTDIYLFIYVILFFAVMVNNGGLIDMLADSWWHMSLANKIASFDSLFLDRHHLTGAKYGIETITYEPNWHASLAFVLTLTDLPAPLLWHALAPWCVMVTFYSYYLLALALTDNRGLGLFSVVLMSLLLGGLNSYLRVSPWPGNISYMVLYFLLFITLLMFTRFAETQKPPYRTVNSVMFPFDVLKNQRVLALTWLICIVSITTLHLAELALYVLAILFYGFVVGALYLRHGKNSASNCLVDRSVLLPYVIVTLIGTLSFALWQFGIGHSIAVIVFVAAASGVLLYGQVYRITSEYPRRVLRVTISFTAAIAMLVLIDFEHVKTLFYPRADSFSYYAYYIPEWKPGFFDDKVRVPYWEHQLRGGLLFSGLIGVLASIWLFLRKRTRGTIFLFANSVVPLAVLITPYLFTYFVYFLPDYGVYRVQLLVLYPISIAYALARLLQASKVFRIRSVANARP